MRRSRPSSRRSSTRTASRSTRARTIRRAATTPTSSRPGDPATRRHPQYWICIADAGDPDGNTFSADSRKFMNFENTDPTDPPLVDIDAHDCPTRFGTQLAALDAAVVEPYVPGRARRPRRRRRRRSRRSAPTTAATRSTARRSSTTASSCRSTTCSPIPTDPRSGANEGGAALRPHDAALLRLRAEVPLRVPAAGRAGAPGTRAARARRTRRSASRSAP